MEIIEFSNMLIQARERAGLSRYAIGLKMRLPDAHMRRIERAQNNYSLKKVFSYLDTLECTLILKKGTNEIELAGVDDCVNLIIQERGQLNRNCFANQLGITRLALLNIEQKNTTARIQTFLHIIEHLGYQVDRIN